MFRKQIYIIFSLIAYIMELSSYGTIECVLSWISMMNMRDPLEEFAFIINNHCLSQVATIIKSRYVYVYYSGQNDYEFKIVVTNS